MAKALVGGMSLLVAMSDGLIAPDDPACKYIAEWRSDPIKSKITIRQLATHTSGIEDAEQDSISHDKLPGWKGAFWRRSPLPLRQVCTVATSTLLKTRLFDPFGIPEGAWSIGYGRGYEVGGLNLYANWGGASFTARAAARIGQLMMLGGIWNGRELVHRAAVKQVTAYAGMPN